MRYRFGEFGLDSGTRQLLRAGREVAVGPKAFELLELLVRSRPKVLSRTRLRSTLWPGAHVGPTSLHALVSQVRAALDDDAREPRWIRTVYGFGYAFLGTASEEESGPRGLPAREGDPGAAGACLVSDEGRFVLEEGENLLGRQKGAAVTVGSAGVSRRHARITLSAGRATLEDLGSKNGTFVREERVSSPRVLEDGDLIRLGTRVLLVFRSGGDARTETEPP